MNINFEFIHILVVQDAGSDELSALDAECLIIVNW